MPRLPRGPTTTAKEQLAQQQERQVELLYKQTDKWRRTPEWLDRVIHICRTSRGELGLLDRARPEAGDRATVLEKIADHSDAVHVQLHTVVGPSTVPCKPAQRSVCTSILPTLVAHFRACKAIRGDLPLARLRMYALRSRRALSDDIPELARTSGGAVAYLHDKFRFKHRHIALLCLLQEGGKLPIAESALQKRTDAVKKAYSSVPKEQRPKVRGLSWKDV